MELFFFKYPRVNLPATRVNLPAFFWRDHFCTIDHITDRLEYSQVKETETWKPKRGNGNTFPRNVFTFLDFRQAKTIVP
jgi:hypothetical protein